MTAPQVLRLAAGRVALRYHRRAVVVCLVLLVAVLALFVAALATGDFVVPVPRVFDTLVGRGTRATDFIVLDLRLPRAVTAVGVGAALGAAGAMFQSLTRNPLGSPDIIGFTQGAATAAVFDLTVLHGDTAELAVAAVIGGSVTATVVYLLAFRHGAQGYRLVLVGIGIGAMMLALVHYLLTRADLADAFSAQRWLVGSLNDTGWPQAAAAGAALLVLLPPALTLSGRLNLLEMGDDTATALGVRTERTRLAALAVAVLLSAVATSCAGPVVFVALCAPQVARRLTRAGGVGVLPAAVLGALLLLVSDFVAEHAFGGTELPVGVVTGAVGGGYLAWLLARQWRAT